MCDHPGRSPSIYSYDYKTITPLKQFGEQHHVSILVVHHLRKGSSDDPMEEFSGSLGLTGSTDCNMVLSRLHKSDEGTLHITGNYVENQEVSLHFDKERTTWEKTDAPAEEPKNLSPERQAILNLLRQQGCPMAPVEIARRLDKDRSSVRRILHAMKGDEQVVVVGQGMYMLTASAQQQTLIEDDPEEGVWGEQGEQGGWIGSGSGPRAVRGLMDGPRTAPNTPEQSPTGT